MFAGLRASVRYCQDLGYVFVDDGHSTFRMEEALFEDLKEQALSSQGSALLARYPTLFQEYSSRLEAEATYEDSEF